MTCFTKDFLLALVSLHLRAYRVAQIFNSSFEVIRKCFILAKLRGASSFKLTTPIC